MIVYLDTNIVIYAVERHPVFGVRTQARLALSLSLGDIFMISELTRMECLVGPMKTGNAALETDFRAFFTSAGVRVEAITGAVCERAARIRAETTIKAMDALHLAAAVEHRADVFLTNDVRLAAFTGVRVEVLR